MLVRSAAIPAAERRACSPGGPAAVGLQTDTKAPVQPLRTGALTSLEVRNDVAKTGHRLVDVLPCQHNASTEAARLRKEGCVVKLH